MSGFVIREWNLSPYPGDMAPLHAALGVIDEERCDAEERGPEEGLIRRAAHA